MGNSKRAYGEARMIPKIGVAGALLAVIALGCSHQPAPKTDSKSISQEAEKMKKIHEREMKGQ